MPKKRNTNSTQVSGRNDRYDSRAADSVVVIFCLLGAFFSFWFFWQDLNRSINHHTEPVGTVTYKQRAAQRRLSDRALWDRLRQESPVYDGDIIRTAELSDATVTLNSGASFSLSENSLIQIRCRDNQESILLEEGEISVSNKTGNLMVLSSAGNRLDIASTVARVKVSAEGDFSLNIIEGSAVLHTRDGGVLAQEAGDTFFISAAGETRRTPRVVVFSPLPDEQIETAEDNAELRFFWKKVEFSPEDHTRVELASDRRFTRVLQSGEFSGTTAELEVPPGVFFWRAYAEKPDQSSFPDQAASGKITIRGGGETVVPVLTSVYAFHEPESPPAETPAAPRPRPPRAHRRSRPCPPRPDGGPKRISYTALTPYGGAAASPSAGTPYPAPARISSPLWKKDRTAKPGRSLKRNRPGLRPIRWMISAA